MSPTETWQILISEEASGGAGGGNIGGEGGGSTTSQTETAKGQKTFFDEFGKYWNAWKPFLMVGGMLTAMYKSSQLVSDNVKTMWSILTAMMELVLLPLMPLFIRIFEAVAPLVKKVGDLAAAFLDPIVNFLMPILDGILNWIVSFPFEKFETWLGAVSESIVSVLNTLWNVGVTIWTSILNVWETLKSVWDAVYTTVGGMVENVWNSVKDVWTIIGGVWNSISETVGGTLTTIWNTLTNIWDSIKTAVGDKLDSIWATLENSWDTLIGLPVAIGQSMSNFFTGGGEGKWYDPRNWGKNQLDSEQLGGYIPQTGLYKLHRGEEVITAGETGNLSGRAIEVQNNFIIELQTSGDVETLVREIEKRVTESLTTGLRSI